MGGITVVRVVGALRCARLPRGLPRGGEGSARFDMRERICVHSVGSERTSALLGFGWRIPSKGQLRGSFAHGF